MTASSPSDRLLRRRQISRALLLMASGVLLATANSAIAGTLRIMPLFVYFVYFVVGSRDPQHDTDLF